MRNVLVVLIALVIAMTPIFGAGQTERVPAQKTVTVFGAFVDEEAHRFEESIRRLKRRPASRSSTKVQKTSRP